MDTPPRSPPEPPADEVLLEMVGAAPVPTQLKERPEMTARQRWHWAYNQIIMQLNVRTIYKRDVIFIFYFLRVTKVTPLTERAMAIESINAARQYRYSPRLVRERLVNDRGNDL